MNRFFRSLLVAATLALGITLPAFAGTVPLLSGPQDPSQLNATLNGLIVQMNQTYGLGVNTTASGTTAVTASSLRAKISITGLTTAASTLSATVTVTNTLVAANSNVLCQTNGYSGTGIPIVVNIVPAAGSFTFAIQNVSTGAALNATVPISCIVFN